MQKEPACLEILLTKIAFILYGKSVYKDFADRLPLKGWEHVLDFGCGMGTVAYYAAKKLPLGHLTCLDISERWLKTCRKTLRRYGNINYLLWKSPVLNKKSLDVVYCHFVLHDISHGELEKVIQLLVESLKPGGILAFREPLNETEKISLIKLLVEQKGLILKDSRITDIPMMGNALESIYIKE
ncbi:MAG: class I SAM-dependent methyltransferase [Caldicoprobacterales bacterium]|mgnify:CR=1 FL=1|jgi:SAM-dependent methyltransferase|nr:class I SAM-dependent methyltransferase [Clostridiales bacterium]